jgi:hypothetical protein
MRKILMILSIFILLLILGCNKIDPKKYGNNCRIERTCGDMIGIDCQSNLDGPYYYIDGNSGNIISTCGGACMGGTCTNCPPTGWNCETY